MNRHLVRAAEVTALRQKTRAIDEEPTVKVNESIAKAAFYYEKLRNVIDYQDEHLFLKNAIKRIIKRHRVFAANGIPEKLLRELVWAGYFENNSLPTRYVEDIDQILKKYEFIKTNIGSKTLRRKKLNSVFSGLIACDIESLLSPAVSKEEFICFAKEIIKKNISLNPSEIGANELDIQIDISIERLLFMSDYDQIFFKLIGKSYDQWPDITKEKARDLASNFSRIYGLINNSINQNKKSKIQKYVKKQLPVFLVLWNVIVSNRDPEGLLKSRSKVKELSKLFIESRNKELVRKVMRALARGVLFVLLTKTVFALLIEYPYELKVLQEINYPALIINVSLPPIVLVIAGLFIKIPSGSNSEKLLRMVESVAFADTLPAKPLVSLSGKRSRNYVVYNTVYFLLSLAILVVVGWGLDKIHFNPVSIALFYMFVSLVSFLAFRTRATAKELEVEVSEDGLVAGVINFLLLPFVSIGKYLSDKWSEYNFTLFFWDFIVEAPFKTIILVFESWLSFTREKREDFE